MHLLLIRHGEPERVPGGTVAADPGLHERGVRQARRLASYLGGERIDALYSSPKRRATETAAPVAAQAELDVEVVEHLSEFDRFSTSYLPIEEMRATGDPRYLAMVRDDYSGYGIDMDEFRIEVVGALEAIVDAHPGQTVAVFCHGGVINAYAAHVIGVARHSFFTPDYTGVSRLAASRGGVRSIVGLNDTAHLRGSDLLLR